MRTIGIDVSHWEGLIDWNKAAPGLGFAYFKCTDGITGVDDKFMDNCIGTKNENIAAAPFHWYHPEMPGIDQANHFVNVAAHNGIKKFGKYIIDVEEPLPSTMTYSLNWLNLKALCSRIEFLTHTIPAIYTGYYKWLESMGNQPAAIRYDLLLARYTYAKNPVCPYPWSKPKIWQFTDYGFWGGCSTEVDMDWFYGTPQECFNYFYGG